MKKEKKRRDRINVSLRELGDILKDANSLNVSINLILITVRDVIYKVSFVH